MLAGGAHAGAPTPRGPYVPPPTRIWPRVDVICIDNASMQHLGRYPFDRALHAKLLDKLVAAGARVVAFDVYFGNPRSPQGDAALASAIARSGRTWLIVDPVTAAEDNPKMPLPLFARAAQWRIGNPSIDQGMHFVGGISMKPFGKSKMPHLLVGILADYMRLRRWPYQTPDGNHVYVGSYVMPAPGGSFTADNSDTRRLAINADSRLQLHSYWRVLQPDYPMARFKDAIVIIGRTPNPRDGEELIFEDWSIPAWTMKAHVEALGIIMEKMVRYLDVKR